jgi:hypothetical protein
MAPHRRYCIEISYFSINGAKSEQEIFFLGVSIFAWQDFCIFYSNVKRLHLTAHEDMYCYFRDIFHLALRYDDARYQFVISPTDMLTQGITFNYSICTRALRYVDERYQFWLNNLENYPPEVPKALRCLWVLEHPLHLGFQVVRAILEKTLQKMKMKTHRNAVV